MGNSAMRIVRPFLSENQFDAMRALMEEGCNDAGESLKGSFFIEKFVDLANVITEMPDTDATGEQGADDDAIVYLHYYVGCSDWYILRKGGEGGVKEGYGYVVVNNDDLNAECRAVSIEELTVCDALLDLKFVPRSLAEVKADRARK